MREHLAELSDCLELNALAPRGYEETYPQWDPEMVQLTFLRIELANQQYTPVGNKCKVANN